jgi:hypothetical protein
MSLVPNTQKFESPLSKAVQTTELPGARWVAQIQYRNLESSYARILKAFLAQLRGMSGRFYLYDMSHRTPAGTAAGLPVVSGAGQVGSSIVTSGWTANQSALLLPGDYIGIGGELKIVIAQAASNGSGVSTISFEPPLRSSPANGSGIVTSSPTCIMRLADDEQDSITIEPGKTVPTVSLKAVEVF